MTTKMQSPQFPLNDVFSHSTPTHQFEIRWTRVGKASGTPLVFIHGTPWSSAEWDGLVSVLKDRYCIYIYNHPGFEGSPRPKRHDGGESELDGSLALRAEASAALFKHWSFSQPPHVVAHDNGGLVSLRLVLEHEIKFASLCLVDVVAMGPFGLPFFDLVANNKAVFQAIPAMFLEGFVRAYIRSATFKPLDQQTENMLAAQWLEDGSQGTARFLQEMEQSHNRTTKGLEKRYAEVGNRIPIKIIWGRDDRWIPSETATRLSKALNASEVVLIEQAGHLVQYDQPGKLAFEVGTWLVEHDG